MRGQLHYRFQVNENETIINDGNNLTTRSSFYNKLRHVLVDRYSVLLILIQNLLIFGFCLTLVEISEYKIPPPSI